MPALSPSPTGPVAPLPSATAWCETVATDDADALAQAQHHWSLHYDQLSSGGFRGALTHVQLPGMRLVHEQANCGLRQRGDLGRDHCGFAMTVDQAGAAFFKGQPLTADTMMIGRSEELDLTSTAAFGVVGVVVERPLLHSLWERMYQRPASAWLEQQVVVEVQPGMRAAVQALHLEALQRVADCPICCSTPMQRARCVTPC